MKTLSILICLFLNAICLYSIDPKFVWKIDGEETLTNSYTVSDDGNTLYIQFFHRQGDIGSNYIYIWDIPNNKLIDSMPASTLYSGMVVSTDQKQLVCIDVSSNGTYVYDIEKRKNVRTDWAETTSPIFPGIFRISRVWGENNYAVFEWSYKKIQIFSFDTGEKVREIECEGIDQNSSFFFSKNGKYTAAINSIDTTVNIYSMSDGMRIKKIKISAFPENISFANESPYFLINFKSEYKSFKVPVYDFESGNLIKEFTTNEAPSYSIFLANDEKIFTTYFPHSDIQVNFLHSTMQTMIEGDFKYGLLSNYPSGNFICAVENSGDFSIFNTQTLESIFTINQKISNNLFNCTKSEITPDDKYIITTGDNGNIIIRDLMSGNYLSKMKYGNKIISIDFSADSRAMMLTDINSKITKWDISNISAPKLIKNYQLTNSIRSAINYDGKFIISGGIDKTLKLINTDNDEITVIDTSDIRIQALAFSNDSKKIAFCTSWHLVFMEYNDTKKIYERVAYIKADSSNSAYSGGIQDVQFSNDDKYVTISASDSKSRVYSADDYKLINIYRPGTGETSHSLITKSILFENNEYLFAGDGLPQLKIYNTNTRKSQWTEKYDAGKGLSGANITKDSKYLFVSYYDATMALYRINGPTAVEDQNYISGSISISPNPASDFIEISIPELNNGASPIASVQIFNTLGIEIKNLTPALSINGEGVRIDISHLPTGVYFIKIGDKVEKLVKM